MKIRIILIIAAVIFSHQIFAQTTTPLPAKEIVANVVKLAKAENKNVLIIFRASWCGWCRKMDAAINDTVINKFFTDNYVITHLTTGEYAEKKALENSGAEEYLKQFNGEKQGLPYWAVLNDKGELLFDSQMKAEGTSKGGNMGCPASKEEVTAFIDILRKSSKLTKKELELIFTKFRKNDPSYKE